MSEFLSPGLFIEEIAQDVPTTTQVSTSNAAFVGFTPMGPAEEATLVTSYPDAVRKFGGLTRKGLLMYMLGAFFTNGGSRGFVSRVTPSDAVAASGAILSKTYDQRIETADGTTATFTKTASTSVLKDHDGATPLVGRSVTFNWRSVGVDVSDQPARQRDGSTLLVGADGVTTYEGRFDPKATLLANGATNGHVLYRSVAEGGTDVQVAHVIAGPSQTLAVTVSGRRVLVRLATDSSSVVTSTATLVAAAVTASTAATALLTATALGAGSGLVAAFEVTNLQGMPPFRSGLDAIVPGSMAITWTAGGSVMAVVFDGVTSTPTQTATNGAGSTATIDLRTGRFSLTTAPTETPAPGDAGISMLMYYTPTSATRSITDNGAGVFPAGATLASPGSISLADGSYSFTTQAPAVASFSFGTAPDGRITTTLDFPGVLGNEYTLTVVLPSGTSALSATLVGTAITVRLAVTAGTATAGANTATLIAAAITALPGVSAVASGSGVTEYTTALAASPFTGGQDDTRPHAFAAVIATYLIRAWATAPVSGGAWGSLLRTRVTGDPTTYVPATASFAKFVVDTYLKDETTGAYSRVEGFDELVFDDPTDALFWADVENDLSSYLVVTEPGANEAPGQLQGVARSCVIGAGDGALGSRIFSVTLPDAPIAPRSITITYTDTTGTVRTIADNGFGVLSGSIAPGYAATVGGLGPNRVTLATGALNFQVLYAIQVGTLVTVTYYSQPELAALVGDLGDATYGYTAGSDGTFASTTYGRNQLTEPLTLSPAGKGIYALDRVDELMQVVLPDFAGNVTISQDLVDYAEGRASSNPSGGDRFVILSVPRGSTAQEATDWVQNQLGRQTKYAAVYWPWVKVADPLAGGRDTAMAPLGHIAGVFARTDATRNVGKTPAGTVDGQLRGLSGLEYNPTQGDRDYVYPRNVNPLRADAQVGIAVWGGRTIAALSVWRNINAVRLFMFVEKSVFNSTHWIVFENNGPGLWAKINLQLEGFLSNLYIDGYFAGGTKAEAYGIRVDRTNNPQVVIDAGEVVIGVALAPNKPAEFVRFQFSQRSLAA